MREVQGVYDDRFSTLRDLFQGNPDAGGASIAVVRNGVFLVDLWGGWADTRAQHSVGARHHHDHLVGDQDDDSARRPGVGGSWRAGCVLAGRQIPAGVRGPKATRASRFVICCRTHRAAPAGSRRSPTKTSTTGSGRHRCWQRRRPDGSRAALRATTTPAMAIWSARSSGG
jgi:hypothetical protein